MAAIFRDTFFAYLLGSAFESRVSPRPNEKVSPKILQEQPSQVSLPYSTQSTLGGVPITDTASVHSEATAVRRGDPEKGEDVFLVEWDGPTDPDVGYCCVMIVQTGNTCLRAFVSCRTHRTGRVQGRHGSCSRCVF